MELGDFASGGAGGGFIAAIAYFYNKFMESRKEEAMERKLGILVGGIAGQEKELAAFKTYVAQNYSTNDDLKASLDGVREVLRESSANTREGIRDIKTALATMDTKLDGKADK